VSLLQFRRDSKTIEQQNEEIRRRVAANDPTSIYLLANSYHNGLNGFQQDQTKGMELYARAADLGNIKAHSNLADIYYELGILKKAKFHLEAAARQGMKRQGATLDTWTRQTVKWNEL
jgi:TPR repeat protein